MTEEEKAVVSRARLVRVLVYVIVAQLIFTGIIFFTLSRYSIERAEQQTSRALCPLVLILDPIYHQPDPSGVAPSPRLVQLRDAMDALLLSLHC